LKLLSLADQLEAVLSPVAIGLNIEGECSIPALDEGIAFN